MADEPKTEQAAASELNCYTARGYGLPELSSFSVVEITDEATYRGDCAKTWHSVFGKAKQDGQQLCGKKQHEEQQRGEQQHGVQQCGVSVECSSVE